jgi:hypothetical protein
MVGAVAWAQSMNSLTQLLLGIGPVLDVTLTWPAVA